MKGAGRLREASIKATRAENQWGGHYGCVVIHVAIVVIHVEMMTINMASHMGFGAQVSAQIGVPSINVIKKEEERNRG